MKYFLLILAFSVLCLTSNSQVLLADNQSVSSVTYLTTEAFKQKVFDFTKYKVWKYKGTQPAIIDFYTDWCRPCKILAPLVEEVSKDYKGKLVVYKVNIDKDPQLAEIFNIQSIPTVLFIPNTGQPQMNVGLMSKEELNNRIVTFLKVK